MGKINRDLLSKYGRDERSLREVRDLCVGALEKNQNPSQALSDHD